MELYDKKGYLNYELLKKNEQNFNIIIGPRGTGKTYGCLKDVYENKINTLLIRTTKTQLEFINNDENTPFKKVLDDLGVDFLARNDSKYTGAVYEGEVNGDTIKPIRTICRTAALSTFHNMRGFDGSSIKRLVYDEFNEEDGRTSRKGIGSTFFNLYESINRNRELEGEEPLKAWLFGNSNDIFNDILVELKLISKICDMKRGGQEVSVMKEKGIALYLLDKSPVSARKKNTALYKAAGEGDFSDMALGNIFKGIDYNKVQPLPLNQIKPVAQCGEVILYKVKSTGKDYISLHRQGTPKAYTQAEFIRVFDRLAYEIAFERGLTFETPEAKVLTKRLFMK